MVEQKEMYDKEGNSKIHKTEVVKKYKLGSVTIFENMLI